MARWLMFGKSAFHGLGEGAHEVVRVAYEVVTAPPLRSQARWSMKVKHDDGHQRPPSRALPGERDVLCACTNGVVWGSTVHGELSAGMLIGAPMGNLVAYSPIGAVEGVEIDGEPFTAVTVAPEDPEDLEFWRAMKVGVGGEELPVLGAGSIIPAE